jgi:phage terminase Nu1 subunit (DNA packaging protein)
MKSKTHSPNFLSIEFGIDRATALRILKDVEPDGTERGHPVYSIQTFATALELHHLANTSPNNDGAGADGASSLTAARTRITVASAIAKERANMVASGELTRIEDVANMFGGVIEVLRENLFAVPARVSEQIASHSPQDSREIYKIVEQAMCEQMRGVIKSFDEIVTGLAASAAKGETYSVDINPLNLGHADVQ